MNIKKFMFVVVTNFHVVNLPLLTPHGREPHSNYFALTPQGSVDVHLGVVAVDFVLNVQ